LIVEAASLVTSSCSAKFRSMRNCGMGGSDIDLGFLRSLCGPKAVDHQATSLHQDTPQNLSPPRIFLHRLAMGGNFQIEGPLELRPATAAG
jgi:hypothetical protein